MSAGTATVDLQQAAVKQHCKLLRMPTVGTQFSSMADQAVRAGKTHVGYLEALLSAELVSGGGGGSHFGGPGGATPRNLDGGEWRQGGVVNKHSALRAGIFKA